MSEHFDYSRSWTDPEQFPLLWFSRDWNNAEDYPTIETDEQQVRADMQSLHDEVKDYLNNQLIPRVIAEDATVEAWQAQEAARQAAETARAQVEQARVAAEQARALTEQARVAAEQTRAQAEQTRAQAEQTRAQAEADRAAAEQARAQAEQARVDEETGYVAQAEQQAHNAQVYAEGGYPYVEEFDALTGESLGVSKSEFYEHGADDYRDQAKVYAHGGKWVDPATPPGGEVYGSATYSDGAENYAQQAKAYAVGGTYGGYELSVQARSGDGTAVASDFPELPELPELPDFPELPDAPGIPVWTEHTVEKGAKQYAEDAEAAAAEAKAQAEKADTAAGTAQTAASQAGSHASDASQHKQAAKRAYEDAQGVLSDTQQIKRDVNDLKREAESAQQAAAVYAGQAKDFRDSASGILAANQTVERNVSTLSQNTATAAAAAEQSRVGAESAKGQAAGSASQASASASAAALSAAQAQVYAESVNPDAFMAVAMAKADGHEFDEEEGLLYLTSAGVRIEGTGVKVATSGGGGGGGGVTNNAVMTLKNTSGWIYKSVSEGAACDISFEWSSLEEGAPTGDGTLKITVGGTVKHTAQIKQGPHPMDIAPYLNSGTNTVRVTVTDVYGNGRVLNFNLTVVSLTLTSTFDELTIQDGAFEVPFIATAAVAKTVYCKVDNTTLEPLIVTSSGRELSFNIPAQAHGCHKIDLWFDASVDGQPVSSNHKYFNVICVEEGNNRPIIAVDWRRDTVEQFENLEILYRVYDPYSLTAVVSLYSSETMIVENRWVDRTVQHWSIRPETAGDLTLRISCVGADPAAEMASVKLNMAVTETKIPVVAETENLSLHLTSYGRSNAEADPSQWISGDVAATLTNFNFVSDGWLQDEDGITVLRVGGDARVGIPVQLFGQDFRTTGKTIEIEFASRSVLDYDAVLATCWSGMRGLKITAQQANLKSEKVSVETRYKEDEHLRLSFVIEKRSGNRLIISYVNGIISGMVQYPDNDNFAQLDPVTVTLGSNDCTLDIYNIRIYNNGLDRFQILNNWIADTQNLMEKKDRYERNNIFDEFDRILPDTLQKHQCYLILNCPVLPTYKGDVKICSGKYVDPVHPERSFTFEGAEIDVQGTSSQFYYVKNFKIKFKGGFILVSGQTVAVYAMNDNAVPTNEYTFKADVASSEGANNVVLAELYNELCPVKTPAQEADPRVRQCIEGHPIVVFHDDGTGAKFIGKYNFNNDKGTSEVFGFSAGDESWEIKENGNALVSFKNPDFTNWTSSFEARYPKKNTDITRLQQFVEWVASTNTDGLEGEAKAAKLQKFKDEIGNWADVEDAIFYYLFTLIFLCIDQREKNAFPTYYAEMAKWIWLFYDADSSLGTDNKGNLTFAYWMEDIDYTDAGEPVFNGQNNVFWSNLRQCFADRIKAEYRRLRTELAPDGKPLLSYDRVDSLFTAHQSQWSEAVYNEDAWNKGVVPLEKIRDDQYLPMQQGKKEHHLKHWLYNRFRYLDSWAETGEALAENNRIMMRAHAQGNIKLSSYISMYGQVYYNDQLAEKRMLNRDTPYEFEWKAEGAEDAVIGVNSAPMITSLGDLAPLQLEYCHIQYASHLTELKVGDAGEEAPYENGNFVALTLGNNTLLRKLDVRNCTNLTQSVDASGCTNIEEVYFDGTAITGLILPNGGILKKLHLPGTITDLTLVNQPKLTEFVLPSYENITTLRLENIPSIVDGWSILQTLPANSRVRMVGFDWTLDDAEAVLSLYDRLDTMIGLDEHGTNVGKPQMSGTIHIDTITGAQLAEMQSRYPSVKIDYKNITSNLYFYNDDGSQLLYTAECVDGEGGAYVGETPVKAETNEAAYTFAGWSRTPGGDADETAVQNVLADRSVYASFTATPKYAVQYFSDGALVHTQYIIEGGDAYDPVSAGDIDRPTREGDENTAYTFSHWVGELTNVTEPRTIEAAFTVMYAVRFLVDGSEKNVQWVESGADAVDPITAGYIDTPTKASTAQYTYTYSKWDKGFTAVTAPVVVNAVFTATLRTYTVKWMNGSTLLETDANVPYGTVPTYNGSTPVDEINGLPWNGWTPAVGPITGNTTYTATFESPVEVAEIADSWDTILANIENGTYKNVYKVGNYKPLDLGDTFGTVNMQIVAFDADELADGSGYAPVTFLSKDVTKSSSKVGFVTGEGWVTSSARTYTMQAIKAAIPENVRNRIKTVLKVYDIGNYGPTSWATCEDDVWIPSVNELNTKGSSSNQYEKSGVKYSGIYDGTAASRLKTVYGETTYRQYHTRSPYSKSGKSVFDVNSAGNTTGADDTARYAIGFCLGTAEITDSWETIAENIQNGSYKTKYSIGAYKPVDLGSEGVINMQIAAFDADTLADGSGTAAISWVAKELLKTGHRMNPNLSGTTEGTGTIGGWEKCEMRTYLQNYIKPLVPAEVVRQIVAVAKTQTSYNTAGERESQATTDEIWIPSPVELNRSNSSTTTACYELFHDTSRRIKTKAGSTKATTWWARTPNSTSRWEEISTSGSFGNTAPQAANGVCLGFCTGKTPT